MSNLLATGTFFSYDQEVLGMIGRVDLNPPVIATN